MLERDLESLELDRLVASCETVYAVSDVRTGPHPPADAGNLYRSGTTLYLHDLASLQPWVNGLSAEVGAAGRGAGSVFASPAGARVGFHFDPGELFAIQLRGRKRWHVARNEQVRNPHSAWAAGTPVPHRLRLYCTDELPARGPADTETFELTAGSVLYLPRGYWHATETIEDSVSVELGLPLFTWADLAVDAIRTLLFSREEWRERAFGAWGDQHQRAEARRRLASLLRELGPELERLRPGDLVAPLPGEVGAPTTDLAARYRRNPLATFGIEETAGSGDEMVATVRFLSYSLLHLIEKEYELDANSVELCRWVASQADAFTGGQARDAAGMGDEDVVALLEVLVDAGLVCPD